MKKHKKHKVVSLMSQDDGFKWSHLYILSDDKINVGDYYTDLKMKSREHGVMKCETERLYELLQGVEGYKKIIATTDKSLGLPLIHSEFVKNYAKNPVEEVTITFLPDYALVMPVDKFWDKAMIHFWFMDNVSKYLKEGLNPSDVIKELDPTLDHLSFDYNEWVAHH